MWVTAAIRTSTSDSVGEDKSVWVIVKDKERLPERQPFMSLRPCTTGVHDEALARKLR